MKEVYLNDFKPFVSVEIVLTYKGNTRTCVHYVMTFNAKYYESLLKENSLKIIMSLFNKEFSSSINGYVIEQFSSYDKMLSGFYEDIANTDPSLKETAKIISNALSLSTYYSLSTIQEISLKDCTYLLI